MPDNAKSPSEPSMEEIIASISRIITEDKKPNEGPHPVSRESGDILNLTDAVNEDGSVRRLVPLTANSSAQSPVTPAVPEEPSALAERTLEDVVRDLLRPLLQAWLDEHLPGIVERLVREEIARVVGEAGLR